MIANAASLFVRSPRIPPRGNHTHGRSSAWAHFIALSALILCSCPETGIVCRAGTERCGNGCADFSSDSRNCGGCGTACFSGQVCANGACECRSGTVLCSGQCVVLDTDGKNCGRCGNACPGDQVCEASQCRTECHGGTICGPSCVDLMTSTQHCGVCDNACADSQSCHAGTCQWDLVAACFSTGQIAGVQSGSELRGPLQPMGSGPLTLAQYGNVLLAGDSIDDRLNQARLPSLQRLPEYNNLGRAPNQIITDLPYVYSVNSIGHTLQILAPVGDAGCPAVVQPDAGCAWASFLDGGSTLPLMEDGGCFLPVTRAEDAGCVDVLLDDGGSGPLELEDAGCFGPPPPPPPAPMPCFVGSADAGLKLVTVGELDTGANSFPQGVLKASGAVWVPLFGGFGSDSAAGQKMLKVDVSDPRNPHTVATVDFSTVDLKPFPGGTPVARPYSVVELNGKLYVTLNNLNPFSYSPEGPGLLAVVDPVDLSTTVIQLPVEECQNPVYALPAMGKLFISCAGAATYHPPEYYLLETKHAGVVMLDQATGEFATWNPQCPAGSDGGCMPILPSRLAVRDGRVYLGDQNGGRIFVADVRAGALFERRGYAARAMSGPIQACGIDPVINASNVADIISLP